MTAGLASGYDKRISSLAVIAAAVIGATVLSVNAALTWREEAVALADLAAHTHLLEDRASALAAKAKQAGGDARSDSRLLIAGGTSGLVSADLQRIVSDIVQKSGGAVRSLDVPENEPVGDSADATGRKLVRVRLNADIEIMEPGLPDLLYALETNMPMIVVDSVSLRPNRRIETSGGDLVPASADRPLALNLTISAFHLQVDD